MIFVKWIKFEYFKWSCTNLNTGQYLNDNDIVAGKMIQKNTTTDKLHSKKTLKNVKRTII